MKKIGLVLCFIILLMTGCGDNKDTKYRSFNVDSYLFQSFAAYQLKDKQPPDRKYINTLISQNKYDEIDPIQLAIAGLTPTLIIKKKELVKQKKDILKKIENSMKTLKGHSDRVTSVAVYKDKIVSGSKDNTIKIWDFKSGKLLNTLKGHSKAIESIAVDSDKIVSGSWGHAIKIWDLNSGKLLNTLKGHGYIIDSVAIYNDKIISGDRSIISIWDLNSGKLLNTLRGHSGAVDSIAVDNDKIVSGSADDTIKIWDLNSGKLLNTLKGHANKISSVAIYTDKIVSGSWDSTIKIWDLNSGKLLNTLDDKKAYIMDVSIYDDKIVSVSTAGGVKIWDIQSGKLLNEFKGKRSYAHSLAIYNGSFVTGMHDNTINVWNAIDDAEQLKPLLSSTNSKLNRVNKIFSRINRPFIPMLDLQLSTQIAYKYGKIGEYYVPTETYSSSTPNSQVTSINGRSYTSTTWENKTSTYGGRHEDRQGYKAILKVNNNSLNHYLVKTVSTWKGEYTNVESYKTGTWGDGDERNKYVSTHKDGSTAQEFMLRPNSGYKFQAEVGEKKADVTTKVNTAYIIPKSYYDAFNYAMDPKNKALGLIEKFLQDTRVSAWHGRFKEIKRRIKEEIDDQFSRTHIKGATIKLVFPVDFDEDFESILTVKGATQSFDNACIHYKAPFGEGDVFVSDGFYFKEGSKEIKVKDTSINATATVTRVTASCG